jgi:hypothetical protein
MASGDGDDPEEMPGPYDIFPGLDSKDMGPLGVPVPVPDPPTPGEAAPPDPGAAEADGGFASFDDEGQPTTSNGGLTANPQLSTLERAAELGDEYIDTVEEAMDEEMCDLCEQILQNLRNRDLETQVKGVKELAKLKQVAESGADPVEIAEVMEDFEVVDDPNNMF